MFYSQFILAKKGPLGTIWIAAHLERKLRKNQVADTDIGVSVDSILCPDVPIALRLSSHLLLGVVRIYSRKVNYLFHDCSEALLKIKQAFRSAAVDLPPEESTAPYHSITLPETFHLDDFELPDSGDFVDHHVSTKEQITLQDTVGGMKFSSMQFGSDERFGDGIDSQIGLDIDELEMVLTSAPMRASSSTPIMASGMLQGQSSSSMLLTEMGIDRDQRGSVKGYNIQTSNLNEAFSPNDHNVDEIGHSSIVDVPNLESSYCAHAPLTPGLIGEAISTPIPESPALSPQIKHSPSFGEEDLKTDGGLINMSMMEPELAHAPQVVSSRTVLLEGAQQIAGPGEHCEQESTDDFQIKFVAEEAKDLTCEDQNLDNGENTFPDISQMEGLVSSSSLEASNSEVPQDKSPVETGVVTTTSEASTENLLAPAVTSATKSSSLGVEAQPSSNQDLEVVVDPCPQTSLHLRASSSESNQANTHSLESLEPVQDAPEASLEDLCVPSQMPVREKALHSIECIGKQDPHVSSASVIVHNMSGTYLTESVPVAGNTNELSVDLSLKDTELDRLNCSSSPEKMLLAPTSDVDQAKELSQLTVDKGVTESDGSVGRISSLSGRKRRLIDSALVLPNDSSAKMSGRKPFRRSTESIPDDDDLLASILVGKRTPLLRIGPTPPLPKATSLKRPRAMPRLGMLKKVLLDDTTVLHAEVDAVDLLCVISCMSVELSALHSRAYDYVVDHLNSCAELLKESNYSRRSGIIREADEKEPADPTVPNSIGFGRQESPGVSVSTEVGSSMIAYNSDAQEHLQSRAGLPQLEALGNNTPCTVVTTDINEQERNDKAPADGLATGENDPEGRSVDKKMPAVLDSDTLIDVEIECAATDASVMDERGLVSTLDSRLPQVDENLPKGRLTVMLDASSSQDMIHEIGEPTDKAMQEKEGQLGNKVENEAIAHILMDNKEVSIPDISFSEGSEIAGVSSLKPNSDIQNIPSLVGENSCLLEFNLAGSGESSMDFNTAKECSDFCSAIGGTGTDDEADYNEEADDAPNPEEAQSLENSGWSSRTRGVARYLKNLFEGESGRMRKSLAMDHIVAGRSCKEASRMFFETLVLKTKDYIHVEQENPFSYVNIEPRSKLLKSEF
ncbi:N terminus of Rad21 / Rec8 like protein [Musa troglodytarum]|uniref:N terminus of Rad21 / Rec8 like protein n=1 Tax=Musa troglodytarum TaxID=320322 RepID=A0A9E7GN36_9LILI|nr:N terminus of Rad21 / Rec8 like protein [Musa troglodytarum]